MTAIVTDPGAPEPAAGPATVHNVTTAKRKGSSSGDETRRRIADATLETLRNEGIVGTSARAIARTGDFNQALIFYHFGSIDEAIVAAVQTMSDRRLESHRAQLESVQSLTELIDVAKSLHEQDRSEHNMTVLVQAFAGAAGDTEMGPKLYAQLTPWTEMVTGAINRVLDSAVIESAVPHEQITQMISALFLGIELLDDLDPSANTAALFDTLKSLAGLLEGLLDNPLLQALGELGR